MDLYVIRHGRAIDHAELIEDGFRSLTPRGRREAEEVGRALRDAGVVFDAIITSPLVRAVETAELVAVGMKFEGGLDVAVELAPGRHPQSIVEEVLLPRADLGAVAVVGHEPQMSGLCGALLRRAVPSVAKGVAVRLAWEGPEAPAKFKWVIRPGHGKPSKDLDDIGG